MAPTNQAAWLDKAGSPLDVRDAPMPYPGPGEIVVKNAAIAINPLDTHMQDAGVFVQQWPAILGCDIAGEVYEVGEGVTRFKKSDRVTGHAINLTTGRPQDGAYALYTVVPADKAAILPDSISFTDGAVLPMALEAAVCALSVSVPGEALPGVPTPALGLPYPSLDENKPAGKALVVYGGSSSAGSMTTQLASAAGIHVIAIAGKHNFDFAKLAGAATVIDHKDPEVVSKAIATVRESGLDFVGIFDAISTPPTYAHDLEILEKLGGGHLAAVHPPPATGVPENVNAGMIFAVNDAATPVWRDYVTPALETGKLQCLPKPLVVGKGLGSIQGALVKMREGVSAAKLVVEL
ncbi:putative zinc-binding alcohol dehydrogenase domain-containing protein cipB [Aspergillus pseudoustus]|uniref:Zinc-binding alcohol dehydrogenase domain-containing protein cipB n=1 Tax=Aspergillus pseudoustus TaxID=1810923 RepID=A0ABR4K6L3_9EURO